MKTKKTSRPLYDPSSPKLADVVIDVTKTSWMEWTGCTIHITESVWELIAVTPDPKGVQTNARLRDVLFAVWCELFGRSTDARKFKVLAPVWPPEAQEPRTVPLQVKYSPRTDICPILTIMLPNEFL